MNYNYYWCRVIHEERTYMGELSIYANEVRNCRGCYSRIVWLESANRRRCAFNVPDSERVRAGFRQVTRTSTTAPRRNGWSCLREVGDSMNYYSAWPTGYSQRTFGRLQR